jgi:putative Holliday junction resolvase
MPKPIEGYLLGFDFGLRRIGVSVGQTITQTASPETIINSVDGIPDWTHISQIFEQWNPSAIVVGLPMHLDGTEQPLTQSARKFGQRLSGRYHTRVFFIEEQLSSIEAEQRLKDAKKSSHASDAIAAQIILQNWLETEYDNYRGQA